MEAAREAAREAGREAGREAAREETRILERNRHVRGVTTEAEFVNDLREARRYLSSPVLLNFLESRQFMGCLTQQLPNFPAVGASETHRCQPFVTSQIELLDNNRLHLRHSGKTVEVYRETAIDAGFCHRVVDGHTRASFSSRRPDIVSYDRRASGPSFITMLGDVKGCESRDAEFPDAEVGHILGMATQLLEEHQMNRQKIYAFLTDGYRFQYFCCQRRIPSFTYEYSGVYQGMQGWHVSMDFELSLLDDRCFISDTLWFAPN
jgi:hypothetical protein